MAKKPLRPQNPKLKKGQGATDERLPRVAMMELLPF